MIGESNREGAKYSGGKKAGQSQVSIGKRQVTHRCAISEFYTGHLP